MLPTFLCIGAQRAATTWLFNCLREHPDIFVPECKEVHFFNHAYEKGLEYYLNFFVNAGNRKAVGEVTPDYLHCETCPERISKHLPDLKMIVILRNPIERAFSDYRKFVFPQTGWDFEEAIERRPSILKYGLYYAQLENYFSHFRKEQFLILLYEGLANDNTSAIKNVYSFLDVDKEYCPSWIGKTSNVSSFPRLNALLDKYKINWMTDILMRTGADNIVRQILQKKKKTAGAGITAETRKKLAEYFHKPNQQLAELLNIDLSAWK